VIVLAEPVSEHRRVKRERPVEQGGMRIDEQFGRVEAVAGLGGERAVRAQAVERARSEVADMAVEGIAGALGQRDALGLAGTLEEAEFDSRRVRRENRDVRARLVGRHPEPLGRPLADPPAHALPRLACAGGGAGSSER
jgi:hypothetical protein